MSVSECSISERGRSGALRVETKRAEDCAAKFFVVNLEVYSHRSQKASSKGQVQRSSLAKCKKGIRLKSDGEKSVRVGQQVQTGRPMKGWRQSVTDVAKDSTA